LTSTWLLLARNLVGTGAQTEPSSGKRSHGLLPKNRRASQRGATSVACKNKGMKRFSQARRTKEHPAYRQRRHWS